jgi:hypothetical protein
MHVFPRLLPALLLTSLALAAPAQADKITLGSDLKLDAASSLSDTSKIEAHGADTAFWPITVNGGAVTIPADGQVLSVKVKGTVFKEPGAANPANLIHFQSLLPAAADGSREIWLSSGDFYLPIDQPNTITTFEPENLCVKQGGAVDFNNIGGFAYGGSLDAPLDLNPNGSAAHYASGAPFGIFGLASSSSTARYTADNGTKNGMRLQSNTANQAPGAPVGTVMQGKELLMQVVIGTGNDRSEPCGGPRRHPDGTLVDVTPDANYLKVAGSGGKAQQPYVTKDRKFRVGVYCGGQTAAACNGTATLLLGKTKLGTAKFAFPVMKTGFINLRLPKSAFKKLDKSKKRTLKTTLVLQSDVGNFTFPLTLKR